MTITIDRLVMGFLDNNVFIVSDGEATLVVDPSARATAIVSALGGRTLNGIMCTHFHSDHTGALAELRDLTGATVYATEEDAYYIAHPRKVGSSPIPVQEASQVDHVVKDGDEIVLGSMTFQVIHTPGHSKGSMCWYLDPKGDDVVVEGVNKGAIPVLLSGDTLFAGATGRTDFLGGSVSDMYESMVRLAQLPDETLVCPGHNDFTTIGFERPRTFARWAVS